MIIPNIRSSFGRSDAQFVLWILSRGEEDARLREEERLRETGFDQILDDPRTYNAFFSNRDFSTAPARLIFYLLARHALLEDGLDDRQVADYLAALLLTFGGMGGDREVEALLAEFRYLADILDEGDRSDGHRAFQLRAYLGEFALWLTGVFPDHITARVQRRGAPGLQYYESVGATGFRMAARFEDAERHGLDRVYQVCATTFPQLRVALNRIADRHLFPAGGDRIERLLRQVADEFRMKERRKEAH
jgi:hypothetical protein